MQTSKPHLINKILIDILIVKMLNKTQRSSSSSSLPTNRHFQAFIDICIFVILFFSNETFPSNATFYKIQNIGGSFQLQDLLKLIIFLWANPGLFFIYYRLFKHTLQFLQQINVKNVISIQCTVLGFELTTFGT